MGKRLERGLEMSMEKIEEILKYLSITFGHNRILILGGEPFLHNDLLGVIKICKKLGYSVAISTNGISCDLINDDYFIHNVDMLSFSIDGYDKEHHQIFRCANVFPKLIDSVKQSVKNNLQTRFSCTVNYDNCDTAAKIIDLAADLGVKWVCFHYFSPIGKGKSINEKALTPKEWIDFCEDLKKHKRSDVLIEFAPTFCYKNDLDEYVNRGYQGCTARFLERVAVFPDGKIYLCSLFLDTEVNFFNFENNGISVNKNAKNELDIALHLPATCQNCDKATQCRGGCLAYSVLQEQFTKVIRSEDCTSSIIPLCPLWSTKI